MINEIYKCKSIVVVLLKCAHNGKSFAQKCRIEFDLGKRSIPTRHIHKRNT